MVSARRGSGSAKFNWHKICKVGCCVEALDYQSFYGHFMASQHTRYFVLLSYVLAYVILSHCAIFVQYYRPTLTHVITHRHTA